jgi:hypothetical protein
MQVKGRKLDTAALRIQRDKNIPYILFKVLNKGTQSPLLEDPAAFPIAA